MKTVEFTIEKCNDTNQFVGIIPGISGAHSQGDSIKSLLENLKEVCELIELKKCLVTGKFENQIYLIQT